MSAAGETPRISVVIATHRRSASLVRALDAVLAQDVVDDLEILVVDDASGDETPAVLGRYAEALPADRRSRFRWWSLPRNVGAAAARNHALAHARGDYVAIMDDDDVSVAHRLRVQAEILDRRPEIGVVASTVRWVDVDGTEIGLFPGVLARGALPSESWKVFRLLYLDGNKLPNPTLMLRAALARPKFYEDGLRTGEDWLALLRLTAAGVGVATIAEPLVAMQRGESHRSLMSDKEAAFRDQRRVLTQLRHELPHVVSPWLYRRALGRQRAREARYWVGWRGLGLALGAVGTYPFDVFSWRAVHWLWLRAVHKGVRLVLTRRRRVR